MPKEHYTDLARMEKLLTNCEEGSLATVGLDGQPYITVVNHLYIPAETAGEFGRLYFHCALQGRKLINIQHEPRVCFSVYELNRIAIAEHSCDCTVYYDSVIAFGMARVVNDHQDKQAILDALTAKYAGRQLPPAPKAQTYENTGLVEITVTELTGKTKTESG